MYEGDRLIGSVTYREPEFSTKDVDRLLASELLDGDVGPHGIQMADATNPANEYAFDVPDVPSIDFAARALNVKKDQYYKKWPDADERSHRWRVRLVPQSPEKK